MEFEPTVSSLPGWFNVPWLACTIVRLPNACVVLMKTTLTPYSSFPCRGSKVISKTAGGLACVLSAVECSWPLILMHSADSHVENYCEGLSKFYKGLCTHI